jgi:hypothetical protein
MPALTNALVTNLPENVARLSLSRRIWNGMAVEVSEWRGYGTVSHLFPHQSEHRLVALLDEVGSPCEGRLRENHPCPVGYMSRRMDSLPSELDVWGFSHDVRFVSDAMLLIDIAGPGGRGTAASTR